MTIWGRRDSEAPDEEAQESRAEAPESQAGAQDTQESAAEHQAGEPAPAFWRAQGETQEASEAPGRDPADTLPPAYGYVPSAGPEAPAHGEQASGEAPASAMDGNLAGTDSPVTVLTGVVVDEEAAVKDPAPAVAPESATTEVQEPTVAVAREPVVAEAQEPAVTDPRDEAEEAAVTEAQEPAMAETEQRAVAPEPTVTGAGQPAAAITSQRWSEIMVAFVDDPRGSVKMAADAVDEAIDEFVNSVRGRQHDLAATWQSAGADTEQLRTALREYRKLGLRVEQLDLGEKTGG